MMKKRMIAALLLLVSLLTVGCQRLDVVGNTSVVALGQVLDQLPAQREGHYWSLGAPDGSARFLWSADYSQTEEHTVYLEVDARPFLDAGLDVDRLPEGVLQGDVLGLGVTLYLEPLNGTPSPVQSYEHLVRSSPGSISYHMAMDHFGVDLGGGNMFEWAKDMAENEGDIVFALDPQIFLEAGVDVNNIPGWVFDQVETMDTAGNDIVVDKLLKPFNLI